MERSTADKRFYPKSAAGAEAWRRRPPAAALVALLLMVVVVGVSVGPTHTGLAVMSLRQTETHEAPGDGHTDGAQFAEAAMEAEEEEGRFSDTITSSRVNVDGSDDELQQLDLLPQQPEIRVGNAGQQDSSSSINVSLEERTLSFGVCNGFANQRIALISGMILAVELGRTMVLPDLLLDGRKSKRGNTVPFGEIFDVAAFVDGMQSHGNLCITVKPPPARQTTEVHLSKKYNYMAALQDDHATDKHLRLDCPSFRLPADTIVKHEELIFDALHALQPVKRLADIISRVDGRLQSLAASKAYNFLFINTGDEWLAHCERWERLTNGLARDNCANNTDSVGDALRLHRVDPQVPVVLAMSGAAMEDQDIQQAIESLESYEYKVVLRDDIFDDVEGMSSLDREEVALVHTKVEMEEKRAEARVDYYIVLKCNQFIGNSVSTFSALAIMERWHADRFATYYNGGNIPLEMFIPLFPMPWVFTYNDWSAGTEYDQMVKAAVTSAIVAARMKPHCMFSGSEESEMYQWLVGMNVTIIQHEPEWKDALIKEGRRNREAYVKSLSHLYKTDGSMVGAFLRIDIPTLREFDQYNYVLFTDCDVYFRMQMKLVDWGTPLPTAIGMGYERYDLFPYNDGVMLWNMPYMSKTNKKFVKWILSQRNGLNFGAYSNLDQGAFNQFYEKEVRGKPISKNFNAMAYQKFRPQARIVHMHGPKPNHYLQWLRTGKCEFNDMCKIGIDNGFCKYASEYRLYAPDWNVTHTLHRLCGNLKAGIWHM